MVRNVFNYKMHLATTFEIQPLVVATRFYDFAWLDFFPKIIKDKTFKFLEMVESLFPPCPLKSQTFTVTSGPHRKKTKKQLFVNFFHLIYFFISLG